MRTPLIALTLLLAFGSVGCATAPDTAQERAELVSEAQMRLAQFEHEQPELYRAYTDSAHGIAVFPTVGKGGYIFGGSFGQGVVFIDGGVDGYCSITSATVGAQIGGQEYTQILFFENEVALNEFKAGDVAGAAQVSAVAGAADASQHAEYRHGVAVYAIDGNGLMAEATVGAQKFEYLPANVFGD